MQRMSTGLKINSAGDDAAGFMIAKGLEVQISGQHYGLLSLCFPYPVLEGILSQLTNQHFFQSKGLMASDDEKKVMIEKLNPTFIDVAVQFGTAEITTKELLDLRVGDVI